MVKAECGLLCRHVVVAAMGKVDAAPPQIWGRARVSWRVRRDDLWLADADWPARCTAMKDPAGAWILGHLSFNLESSCLLEETCAGQESAACSGAGSPSRACVRTRN